MTEGYGGPEERAPLLSPLSVIFLFRLGLISKWLHTAFTHPSIPLRTATLFWKWIFSSELDTNTIVPMTKAKISGVSEKAEVESSSLPQRPFDVVGSPDSSRSETEKDTSTLSPVARRMLQLSVAMTLQLEPELLRMDTSDAHEMVVLLQNPPWQDHQSLEPNMVIRRASVCISCGI